MRTVLGSLVGTLMIVLGLGLVAPAPPARAEGDLVRVLPSPLSGFSPNGDGRRDTLPVRFHLAEPAQVTVHLEPTDRVIDLGVRSAGVNRWVWDGRGAPGGSYRLILHARTADGRTGRDTRFAEIDPVQDHQVQNRSVSTTSPEPSRTATPVALPSFVLCT